MSKVDVSVKFSTVQSALTTKSDFAAYRILNTLPAMCNNEFHRFINSCSKGIFTS